MNFLVSVIFDRNVLYKKIDTGQTQRSVASDLFIINFLKKLQQSTSQINKRMKILFI